MATSSEPERPAELPIDLGLRDLMKKAASRLRLPITDENIGLWRNSLVDECLAEAAAMADSYYCKPVDIKDHTNWEVVMVKAGEFVGIALDSKCLTAMLECKIPFLDEDEVFVRVDAKEVVFRDRSFSWAGITTKGRTVHAFRPGHTLADKHDCDLPPVRTPNGYTVSVDTEQRCPLTAAECEELRHDEAFGYAGRMVSVARARRKSRTFGDALRCLAALEAAKEAAAAATATAEKNAETVRDLCTREKACREQAEKLRADTETLAKERAALAKERSTLIAARDKANAVQAGQEAQRKELADGMAELARLREDHDLARDALRREREFIAESRDKLAADLNAIADAHVKIADERRDILRDVVAFDREREENCRMLAAERATLTARLQRYTALEGVERKKQLDAAQRIATAASLIIDAIDEGTPASNTPGEGVTGDGPQALARRLAQEALDMLQPPAPAPAAPTPTPPAV